MGVKWRAAAGRHFPSAALGPVTVGGFGDPRFVPCGATHISLTSGEDLIDQLIIFSVEWIDERDALQRETILQIFGEQVLHASTSRRSP